MKKFNKQINFGLLFNGVFLLGNYTDLLPEFIKGLSAGLGLTLIIVGVYSENHDISKLRNFKKGILNKMLSK